MRANITQEQWRAINRKYSPVVVRNVRIYRHRIRHFKGHASKSGGFIVEEYMPLDEDWSWVLECSESTYKLLILCPAGVPV